MRRLLLLGGLIYLLFLVGLASVDGRLLSLALPMVVYLVVALLFGPGNVSMSATRTTSTDRTSQGTPVVVRLSVTNEGSRLEQVLVEDLVPGSLELTGGQSQVMASFSPGETVELEYTLEAVRGGFPFRDVRVTASETLGLFRKQTLLSAPAQLSVLPDVLRLRPLAIRPLRTRGTAGSVPARAGGSGIDFFGVREYRVGDPRRWINWRVSARHPRSLFTNEFEQERIADVGLILDARSRSDVRTDADSLFEHSIRATASLAQAFLSDGNRVGLLIYGQFLDWTFPGYGKVQRERILQSLARATTGDSRIFDTLDYLPTRYFPAQSQLVVVSPLSNSDLSMLKRLRARGYQILVVRPDPVAFELEGLEPEPSVELAARIVRVERLLLLRKLQQAGIQVVDWQVDRPFDHVIHSSLGRVPHWFRAVGVET
jgi:uncharacterized protein (DUF58 family)